MERILLVIVADKSVENKRYVDGEHPHFLGKFELVPVVDVGVEVRSLLRNIELRTN
jgi:hypothetical protein